MEERLLYSLAGGVRSSPSLKPIAHATTFNSKEQSLETPRVHARLRATISGSAEVSKL